MHKGLIDCCSTGKHKLVVAFLKGVNPLNPPCRVMIREWDFNVVLDNLCVHPFSLKTSFLMTISSAKHISE